MLGDLFLRHLNAMSEAIRCVGVVIFDLGLVNQKVVDSEHENLMKRCIRDSGQTTDTHFVNTMGGQILIVDVGEVSHF